MSRLTSKKPKSSMDTLAKSTGLSLEKDLLKYPFIKEKMRVLPYTFVKKRGVIPLKEEEGILFVAIADPFDLETLEEIQYITATEVQDVLAPKEIIDEAIEICYRQNEEEASQSFQELTSTTEVGLFQDSETEYDLLDHSSDSSVIKLLNMILVEALGQEASDIHFDPIDNKMNVRYRVDGVLQKKHSLSKDIQNPLITRIKVLAQLDIAEHRLPQDGRMKLRMGGREIDFRVSTVPVVFGERVVLRILDRSQMIIGLDKLGISKNILSNFRKYTRQSQGIILVTGPTGSGKTTTLYGALSEIRSSSVNVMTIEDPVEIKLEGMAQISVNSKIALDFAKGLRHILRQDPDVIMIGEIRDKETAEIAIQASLTGHLVLSTLHTNDAASAIARLIDMGIEPYLLTSSLLVVLAQRLVRSICPHCKEGYEPSASELEELNLPAKKLDKNLFYKGKGCKHCFDTGYKGRQGLYELMPISSKLKEQILKSADATQLNRIALADGMSSLRREGAQLVRQGVTTTQEVLRVTRQVDEELI